MRNLLLYLSAFTLRALESLLVVFRNRNCEGEGIFAFWAFKFICWHISTSLVDMTKKGQMIYLRRYIRGKKKRISQSTGLTPVGHPREPLILEYSRLLHSSKAAGQEDARASETPFEGRR